MMNFRITPLLCLVSACLGACFPLIDKPDVKVTLTPTPIDETPTATIEWFPPTSTFTPLPSVTLIAFITEAVNPNHGDVILEDNFDDPRAWELGEFQDGIIAMGDQELSLAVKTSRGYLSSLRYEPKLGDYFAEITANPTICHDSDEYGIIFRVASQADFFRFSLTCDGQARLDRFHDGQASSPQPLIKHGSIPPGAPSVSRLGIWISGAEMHFYVNGENIFNISDPTTTPGNFGVFARAAGEDEITVNFSELMMFEVIP